MPDISLTDSQHAALNRIIDWYKDPARQQEFYLAGYAGTGKSTLVDFALRELADRCGLRRDWVRTATFTGKAAHVLRRKGIEGAQTVHSLIYKPVEDPITRQTKWVLDHQGPAADAALIVLEECSMVPMSMADDVRSFGKPILVIGDPGQLPPVKGAGAFTERRPDVFLTEIHRQAAESPIIHLATKARQRQAIAFGDYGGGVRVIRYDAEAGPYVYDPDTQPICGVHRHRIALTQRIRQRLGYEGRRPRNGERILVCRNDNQEAIFNGQQGTVVREPIACRDYPGGIDLTLQVDDRRQPIEVTAHSQLFEQHFNPDAPFVRAPRGMKAQHIDWGYILTCHKSQGSQWPRVTIIDDSGAFREDSHRWLYTAITRAESELTLILRG